MEITNKQERKDPTLTVLELWTFCNKQIQNGNWAKKILITTDDEGNWYHNLYYGFTDDYDEIKETQEFCDLWDIRDDLENYVLLG